MKRSVLVLAAVATAVAAQPSFAAKKPAAAKPVTATYYFHGSSQIGNQDAVNGPLPMDATMPSGSNAKYFLSGAGGATPNDQCASTPVLANWSGKASGTFVGTAKVDFYAAATPAAKAVVQIFPDVTESSCNDAFPTPLAETTIDLKAGPTALNTAMLTMPAKAKVLGSFLVQVDIILPGPEGHAVAYDSTSAPSAVTFTCQPNTGKKTC